MASPSGGSVATNSGRASSVTTSASRRHRAIRSSLLRPSPASDLPTAFERPLSLTK
eukprot:CAMPEP_0171967372 /NCGR_PEP_ID=MMETSP0993-20121228/197378_1 /TAXON_ID=483369 /ORGANISM="non described non described, Strain CCMP2098" /LENGTH=55 /DNA_ID=CAMNT_0012616851 /DNA_START=157 /DNA_END=321 /DNA_ORIENTATION=-